MPFRSQAQRKWMYANKKEMAEQWEKETKVKHLPKRKGSKVAKTSKRKRTPKKQQKKRGMSKVELDIARAVGAMK